MTTIDFYTHCADRLDVAARLTAKAWAQHGTVRVQDYYDRAMRPALVFIAHPGGATALLPDVLQLRAEMANTDDEYQRALVAFWTAKADYDLALGEGVVR